MLTWTKSRLLRPLRLPGVVFEVRVRVRDRVRVRVRVRVRARAS